MDLCWLSRLTCVYVFQSDLSTPIRVSLIVVPDTKVTELMHIVQLGPNRPAQMLEAVFRSKILQKTLQFFVFTCV